ncbi:MAG: NAD-dependent epimerase/dehydratase family protein [Planctomycetaceae bacterium]|nr:NAD-dependent epimerase/dehydratase family protein [Planctomycetaceae bacterium]
MHALVTGGGGFLGLYIVEQLVARGDTVRVLCRGNYQRLTDLRVECVPADIRDEAAVSAACTAVDAVFHVAAVSGIWGPWEHYHGINTQGTLNVLAGCRAQRVPRLVYTSSPSVIYDGRDHCGADESLPYPSRYLCHYPHSKALAEQAVLAANGQDGLATVALRPHLIWGPRDNHLIPRLIERARAGRLRRVGRGDNLISMAYVENAAAAHVQVADRLGLGSKVAGQAYFINDPQPVRMWVWINDILSRGGLSPVTKSVPTSVAYAAGALLETLYAARGLNSEPPMTRFLAQHLGGSHYYSIAKAQQDFDYRPVVSVDEGLLRLEPDVRRLAAGESGRSG